MSFLISNAMAAVTDVGAGAVGSGQADNTFSLLMIVAIFILFYFMLIRPQNKRAKEHRELIRDLKKGDEVVTSGGFMGKVSAIEEQVLKLSLAEGVEVAIQRQAVTSVLPKGTLKAL